MRQLDQNPIRILVVDDEADFRNLLASTLRRRGYEIFSAATGNQALDFIQTHPIDMVISDIRMPDGDGLTLLAGTKALHPEMPVVLLVTGFDEMTFEDASLSGAEALFGKPLDIKSLGETISGFFEPSRGADRRRSDRVTVDLDIRLEFHGLDQEIIAKVTRLNLTGFFAELDTKVNLNINDMVRIKLACGPNLNFPEASGVARWVQVKKNMTGTPGIGIEFTHMSPGFKERVRDLLTPNKTK
jgi:two-component system OmpR family response regulator